MGLKSTLLLNNLNSSLNLIFIRRIEEVKELKIVQNNDNVEFDDESDLQCSGPLSQVTGKKLIIDQMMSNHKKQLT